MTNYEILLDMAEQNGITVTEAFDLSNTRFKGLYCDKVIAIDHSIETNIEKNTILAEELGHYYTTHGNILDMHDTSNCKQEYHARLWAYNKLIGLQGIISAYKHGCTSLYEMADYLEVTEEFLHQALTTYRHRYGCFAQIDNYVVYFEPVLGVLEIL